MIFSLAIGVLYFSVGVINQKSMKNASTQKKTATSNVAAQLSNIIEGRYVTRFYKIDAVITKKMNYAIEQVYLYGKKCANISILNGALEQLGYLLSYGGSLVFGLLQVSQNVVTLSEMLSVWPMAIGVSYSLQRIGFFITSFQNTAAAVDNIHQVELLPIEVNTGSCEIESSTTLVNLQNVCFSYDGVNNALENISIEIKKGERIAFVGESGSGKSTLVRLLMRFYPITDGLYEFNGKPASDYSLSTLRSFFSYVPQTPHIINDSVINNVRIVCPKATMSDVEVACADAFADEFISHLPNGYRTILGKDGVQLSGGQCQRIAFAQALLRNSEVFVFDEISSALDQETEAKINKTITNISRTKTILMITHRLSSAQMADKIVVMAGGKICEIGSHAQLMDKQGLYYSLYNK
jgi:ABC-type multidrug transport system fused ATPase/permease subunit